MVNGLVFSVNLQRRRELQHAIGDLLLRHGGTPSPDLDSKTARCVEQIEHALQETTTDSKSLSPLDVVRIRIGKFAATLTPPSLFRDAKQLAAFRAEIHQMAIAFVGDEGAEGSRFPPSRPK